MAETRFTPGPWVVGGKTSSRVFTQEGQIIADCDREHRNWPVFEANARLIAAGPMTYAELERSTAYLRDAANIAAANGDHGTASLFGEQADRNEAALRQARGETE